MSRDSQVRLSCLITDAGRTNRSQVISPLPRIAAVSNDRPHRHRSSQLSKVEVWVPDSGPSEAGNVGVGPLDSASRVSRLATFRGDVPGRRSERPRSRDLTSSNNVYIEPHTH